MFEAFIERDCKFETKFVSSTMFSPLTRLGKVLFHNFDYLIVYQTQKFIYLTCTAIYNTHPFFQKDKRVYVDDLLFCTSSKSPFLQNIFLALKRLSVSFRMSSCVMIDVFVYSFNFRYICVLRVRILIYLPSRRILKFFSLLFTLSIKKNKPL